MKSGIYIGDCLKILKRFADETVDLVYLDPPFFTQKVQKLGNRERTKEFHFPDTWRSINSYADFVYVRLFELHRLLRKTGSIFFHCDRNASHVARLLLDEIFGKEKFRSEIIWQYRRWSNSQRNLLPAHQSILFYSKTGTYKFNEIIRDYSPSTNVDQILQRRRRNKLGKAVYDRDENGDPISIGLKKGVPLSDVWDIPYLNPKAKERTGYPTQKPILLLERIIELATDKGDVVLDPFCGSGTTLVAAKLLGRNWIGIDISGEAIEMTKQRLKSPQKSNSKLLEVGRESYRTASQYALAQLNGLDVVPVHRNSGIDALLKLKYRGGPVPVRIQRPGEGLLEAGKALYKAARTKNAFAMILVSTQGEELGQPEIRLDINKSLPSEIIVVESTSKAIQKVIQKFEGE